MFHVNDTVLYGTEGICVIEDIATRTFDRKTQEYYVLRPVYGNRSTIFVPTQNEKLCAKMRTLLSPEEIHDMIRAMPGVEPLWIENEAARKQAYGEILRGGDRRALVRLMKTLYLHRHRRPRLLDAPALIVRHRSYVTYGCSAYNGITLP